LPPAYPAPSEFSRPSGLITTLGALGFWARKPVNWTRDTPSNRRPPFQGGAAASDLPGGAPVGDLPFERWNEPPSAVDAAVVFRALFEEVPLELCRYAVRLPDGGTILAIRDEVVDGSSKARGRFMRFDKDWHPDFTFTNWFESDLRSSMTLKRQNDGKLLVAGIVGTMDGEEFPGLVRLEKNGAIDRSFHCETTNALSGRVMDVAVQDDGQIVICGYFTAVNGVERQHIARLNPDGSLDRTFTNRFLSLRGLNSHRRFPVRHLAESPDAPPGANTKALTRGAATPETVFILSLNLEAGAAVIRFNGTPQRSYILQAADALVPGAWLNIQTNQTDASGAGIIRDGEARNHSARFYRIAVP
jgi:hypothetical protein